MLDAPVSLGEHGCRDKDGNSRLTPVIERPELFHVGTAQNAHWLVAKRGV